VPDDLFSEAAARRLDETAPLARRLRPLTLDDFVGQEHVVGRGRALRLAIESDRVPSMILYGPPGSGKTTLARIVAQTTGAAFEELSAVSATVAQVREVLGRARDRLGGSGQRTILFLDEIHRFNKAQQDALLPAVEDGLVTLIGATTENPYFEVNSALMSRVQLYELDPLSEEELASIADRGAAALDVELAPEVLALIVRRAGGDARNALNILELATETAADEGAALAERHVEDAARKRPLAYDKGGDRHYDFISAWIKSTRAGDAQASVYYLAAMLEGGEDARFVARRMIVLASEDIGNADPRALLVAVAAAQAVEHVGLPEARLNLAQAAIYLARAPKSNASYTALARATADVREHGNLMPPAALRSASYWGARKLGRGKGYRYPHDDPLGFEVDCLPDELAGRVYYEPSGIGEEVPVERSAEARPAEG
jgi:putative ATPase